MINARWPAIAIVVACALLQPALARAQDVTDAQVAEAVSDARKTYDKVLAELHAAEKTGDPCRRVERIDDVRASLTAATPAFDRAKELMMLAKLPEARLKELQAAMGSVDALRERITEAVEPLRKFESSKVDRVDRLIAAANRRAEVLAEACAQIAMYPLTWYAELRDALQKYDLDLPKEVWKTPYANDVYAKLGEPGERYRAALYAVREFVSKLQERPEADALAIDSLEVRYLGYLEAVIRCVQRDTPYVKEGQKLLFRVLALRRKMELRDLKELGKDATQLAKDLYDRMTEAWTTEVRPFTLDEQKRAESPAVRSWSQDLEEFRARLRELERKERGQ
jgi:hypothetical protein